MSAAEMQACLARLYVDDGFRKLFKIDRAMALEDYALTEEETTALRVLDRTRLDYFAESLIHKREEKIRRAYPALFTLDSRLIGKYYRRYCSLHIMRPHQTYLRELIDFGEFMEQSLAHAEGAPRYASELAHYERLLCTCEHSDAKEKGQVPHDRPWDGLKSDTGLNSRPVIRPDVEIIVFQYNIPEIEVSLREGQLVDEYHLEKGEYPIVFRQGEDGSAKIFRPNSPTKMVLDLCDGVRTVPRIIADTEAALHTGGLTDAVSSVINRLLELRVVEILDGQALA